MIDLARRAAGLARATAKRERVLLLLDFDGTLCETAPLPDDVRVTPERRKLLGKLTAGPFRVAILSGRSVSDLRRHIRFPQAFYFGNFGLEASGPGLRFLHPAASSSRIRLMRLGAKLGTGLSGYPGVFIENKGLSLGLHHRGVERGRWGNFQRHLLQLRRGLRPGLRWAKGLLAWDVVPDVPWDKGRAALLLWRRLGMPYVLAFGDSASDEPMFQAIRGHGLSVRVGADGPSAADYRLKDVAAVYRFLRLLQREAARQRPKRRSHDLP